MDESRERFDEAAPMIVNALRNGFIEGDGKYYKQPKIDIRPRPSRPHVADRAKAMSATDCLRATERSRGEHHGHWHDDAIRQLRLGKHQG